MSEENGKKGTSLGDEVMAAVGKLDVATTQLKKSADEKCGLKEEEAVSILTIIGRTILGIIGR